jgi:hypothetical protein
LILTRQGNSAMILFPAMMVGGHLMIAVVDKVPDLNFEPICREGLGETLGGKDEFQICIKDESAARDALAKQWSEFQSADRARCIRLGAAGADVRRVGSFLSQAQRNGEKECGAWRFSRC